MENFDISYWVKSPEIAEHLQKLPYGTTTQEQMQLVLNSFRPLREKTNALWTLQRFADSAEERGQAKSMWELYRFAVKELEEERKGILFLGKQCLPRPNIVELDTYGNTHICFTYRELLSYAEQEQWNRMEIEKYRPDGDSTLKVGYFYFERIEGQLCAVDFSLEDEIFPPNTELEKTRKCRVHLRMKRNPFSLPFVAGDLVCLDVPPCLEEPIYGVLHSSVDCYGDRCVWLGYIRNGQLQDLDLSYVQIEMDKGYQVIDWLHSAEPSMLPVGHEILVELGTYLKGLSPQKAEEVFFRVFSLYGPLSIYRKTPVALEDLFPSDFSFPANKMDAAKCAVLTVGLTDKQIAELKCFLPPNTMVNQMVKTERYCLYPKKQLLDRYSRYHCVIINPQALSDETLQHILPAPEEYGEKRHIPMLLLTEEREAFPSIPAAFDAKSGKPTQKLRCAVELLERMHLSSCRNMKNWMDHLWHGGWWLLDIETSGLYAQQDDAIAFRLVYMDNFQPAEEMEILIRPRKPLRPEIEKLTGITNSMLENAVPLADALNMLEDLAAEAPLVLIERSFSERFLLAAYRRCERPMCLPILHLDRATAIAYGYFLEKKLSKLVQKLCLPHSSSSKPSNIYLNRSYCLAASVFQELESRYNICTPKQLCDSFH